MRIKMINCPCCGAQLDIDEKAKRSRCRFCGTHFYIEDDEIGVCEDSGQKEEKRNYAINNQNVSTGYAVARSESVSFGYSSGYAGHYASSDDRAEHKSANFSDGYKVEKVSAKELEKFNGLTSSVDSGWGWYLEIVKTILSIVLPALLLCVLINIFFPSEKDSQADTENVMQEICVGEAEDFSNILKENGVDVSGWDVSKVTDMSALFKDTAETEESESEFLSK